MMAGDQPRTARIDVQEGSGSGSSTVAERKHPDSYNDPAIAAEVERLLARRTRDIHLQEEIERLFQARMWSQTAKIVHAWMMWYARHLVFTLKC
jgi:hypothetical protein